jgi:putative ABC transport system permease protein
MIRNFLKVAVRNLLRRKGYAVLNIFGLAIGISCCLVIFEYVAYEKSYDSFHADADRIFRVQDEDHEGPLVLNCAAAMPGVAPAMKREFPEVENACRLFKSGYVLGNDARNLRFRETVYYADPAVLDLFYLPLDKGDKAAALSGPGKIILSETEARKYFGGTDPLGKMLTVYDGIGSRSLTLEVTGVFRDYPANSHLRLSILVSYPTFSKLNGTYGQTNDILETSFGWTDFYTYILLRQGTNPQTVTARLPAFIDRHYNDLPENKSAGDRISLSLMPLKDIHLYSHYTEEAEANGDGHSVNFLLLIAFFIIGIAWINYINLATARSLERAREVGVRKVLGALRLQLIRQFMLESLLMNLLALIVALAITLLLNPFFGRLSGRPLPFFYSLPATYWQYFAALFVAGTLLSGIYPALALSRYQPITVLKGIFKNAAGGQLLRKGLIVGQFTASIILIAGTMIVFRQVHYMRSQSLGVDINQTLVLKAAGSGMGDSTYSDSYQAFKGDMLKIPGVRSLTASSEVMGDEILWSTDWRRLHSGSRQVANLFHLGVDDDFITGYGLRVLAGRPFSRQYGDRKAVILNESAVRVLGIASPQAAIGELLSGGQGNMDSLEVVGVVADYHNEGLQKAIQPLILLPNRNTRHYYSVKIQGDPAATVAGIKKAWDRHFPADPYDYFFLDEFFDQQYAENQRFGQVFGLFASLTILIACFGLLGLSAYSVIQRTKEIGIRKVLGASTQNLIFILSKDFLLLVCIAFVIAIPVTLLAMNGWLEEFAYRIHVSWWVFAAAGLLAIFIALLIVGIQALKATLANPVKSLRSE